MADCEVYPNPLVKQVLFAIRFPNLFFLGDHIGKFQIKVMKDFPKSSVVLRRPFVITEEADTEKLQRMVADLREEQDVNRVWQFESDDGVKLEVASSLLALVSTSHKSYRHGKNGCFRDMINFVTQTFYNLTELPVINRIGLRYIDECPVFENNTEGFQRHYATVLPLVRFPLEEAISMECRSDVKRDSHNLRYAESLKGKGVERKLTLDFDAWSENIEPSETMDVTDQLHDIIWNEFQSTIKEPVREFMRKPAE